MSVSSQFLHYTNNNIKSLMTQRLSTSTSSKRYSPKNDNNEHKFNFLTLSKKTPKLNQSIDKLQMEYQIRQELRNTLCKDEKVEYVTAPSFFKNKVKLKAKKIQIYSENKKENYIHNMFSNFISKIKSSYTSLLNDFNSYFNLFIKEEAEIKSSHDKQFTIFKSIINKLQEKITVTDNDININNSILNLYDELLRDFLNVISKNISSKCAYFISSYFSISKRIQLINFEILSSRVRAKDKEIENANETVEEIKKQIEKIENYNIELKTKLANYDEIYQSNLDEINKAKEENEILNDKIKELEGNAKIKEYEMEVMNKKITELKKYGRGIEEGKRGMNYEDKLNLDALLQRRLDRIKFYKFKKDVKKNKDNK